MENVTREEKAQTEFIQTSNLDTRSKVLIAEGQQIFPDYVISKVLTESRNICLVSKSLSGMGDIFIKIVTDQR
jgi:hypothetical protein